MSYESIKNEFESNSRVKFKLYSLEYLIERVDNYVQVYAIDYPTRKSKYNTLEELLLIDHAYELYKTRID